MTRTLLWATLSAAAASLAAGGAPRTLPDGPLIAAYAPQCNDNVTRAARQGVNVIYWFSIQLVHNSSTGAPYVSAGQPDLDCIAGVAAQLASEGLPTVHLVTIGGWDAPHVDDGGNDTAAAVYAAWKAWNEGIVARPGLPSGFAGLDWDMEGFDDPANPDNTFTVHTLDVMGGVSQLAKVDGYIVSMVPPESYLDPTTPLFDRSLLHAYPEGPADFKYHGHNPYAYLLSRYGETQPPSGGAPLRTFDLVLVQVYETYSHLTMAVLGGGVPPAQYLSTWTPQLINGWHVDFSSDPAIGWPSQTVSVPADTLLIGFANAWAAPPKQAPVMPPEIGAAHANLTARGLAPRGYFYWWIGDEGAVPANSSEPLYFAQGLNDFLHVRQ